MSGAPTSAEVLADVERVAREKLGWKGRLEPEMRLVEDLELDSLANLTLAIEIENHFRIHLDEEDEEAIETVADLVRIIERKRG